MLSDSHPAARPSKRSTTIQNATLKTRTFLPFEDDGERRNRIMMQALEHRRQNGVGSWRMELLEATIDCHPWLAASRDSVGWTSSSFGCHDTGYRDIHVSTCVDDGD